MQKNKATNIQPEVKENSAHSSKVTSFQLKVKENSAHNTKRNKHSTTSQRKECA